MVSSPISNLPSLSPSDRTLLSAYLDALQDLPTLAARCGHDYLDLLLWLAQPHIQAILTAQDQAQSRSDRCLATHTLRATLDIADNNIELRRAATTLLRTGLIRTAPSAPRSTQSARDTYRPPSPRLDGERWPEAPRRPERGVPASEPAPNGHASVTESREPRASTPRTQGPQSLGSPPPAHTFTEPTPIPFPRLPHHSPAADLRAKAGAAPPPSPLARLIENPLPRSASP